MVEVSQNAHLRMDPRDFFLGEHFQRDLLDGDEGAGGQVDATVHNTHCTTPQSLPDAVAISDNFLLTKAIQALKCPLLLGVGGKNLSDFFIFGLQADGLTAALLGGNADIGAQIKKGATDVDLVAVDGEVERGLAGFVADVDVGGCFDEELAGPHTPHEGRAVEWRFPNLILRVDVHRQLQTPLQDFFNFLPFELAVGEDVVDERAARVRLGHQRAIRSRLVQQIPADLHVLLRLGPARPCTV